MARRRRTVPPSLSALSNALQAMRKRRNLTQAALAQRTGQTQAYISAIENATHDPRASTLSALAAALGCEWILVPKDRAREALRSAGLTGQPPLPATLLDEVSVPEPDGADNNAS
jgi:transcriptional regulator with XRE-family HTH domain